MSIRVYKRKHKNTITWTASVTVRGITPQRKPHTRGGFPTREQADQYAKAKEQELLGRLEGIPKLKGVRFDSFAIEYLELCKKNNTQKHYATKNYVILKSIGIVINGGKNNVIENNIAVDCRYMLRTWSPAKYWASQMGDFMVSNRFCGNIFYRSQPSDGHLYLLHHWTDRVLGQSDNNLFFNGATGEYNIHIELDGFKTLTIVDWQKMGYDTHSIIADPLFVDSEHDDYRLKPESPAFRLGFSPIDTKKIGIGDGNK